MTNSEPSNILNDIAMVNVLTDSFYIDIMPVLANKSAFRRFALPACFLHRLMKTFYRLTGIGRGS